jgi:hypothetical protein
MSLLSRGLSQCAEVQFSAAIPEPDIRRRQIVRHQRREPPWMMQAATSIQKAHSLMRGMKTLTIASSVITKEIMNPKPIAVSPGHNHATKEAPDARETPRPPPKRGIAGVRNVLAAEMIST